MTDPRTARTDPGAFGDDPLEEHVVDREVVHRGRYLEFRVDTIERADGSGGTRDVVGHPGAIAVLAVDGDGRLLLVRQWRIPAAQRDPRDPGRDARRPRRASPRTRTSPPGASWRRRRATARRPGASWRRSGPRPGSRRS